ncbi:MAG: hypothetical protein ACI90V_008116, partial [Bacillariaceae sp.]
LGMQAAKRLSSSSSLNNLIGGETEGQRRQQQHQQSRDNNNNNQKNVGILAIEVYTPSTYISQSDLEEHSGVSKGKYTLGLGQDGLGITGDAEDVNSLSLTVVHSLLEK